MKHILVISTSYPQKKDGSEAAGSFVADFVVELSKHVRVTVLAPALKAGAQKISDTLNEKYFAAPKLPLSLLKPYNPMHWPAIIGTLHRGSRAVREICASTKIDHIFSLWVLPSGYWARQGDGIPYSTWALGSDIWSLGRIPVIKDILITTLKESHVNFADGYKLADDVSALSSRPCQFLPSTREIGLPKPKTLAISPPYKLSFIGRWHQNKGVDILLRTLANLSDDDWALIAEIRIAGGGPLGNWVRKKVSELRSSGRPIYLKGYLNKQEATELLSWTDYLLIPSRIESIPVIFSDAIKCQCPIATMPTGDLPRLLKNHKVGALAEDISALEFAIAIRELLSTSPSRYEEELKAAGDIFSIDSTIETFIEKIVVDHPQQDD